ncbi:PA0050 family protein [Burkholderia ubonensis]|uniref:PA0050 family protein n=1 Tax=Burkholderia ubonensis TaxID=101571 RepID=UPI000AF15B15
MKIKILLAALMLTSSMSAMAACAVLGPSKPKPCKPVAVVGPTPITCGCNLPGR